MAIPDWSAQPLDELLDAETREVLYESLMKLPEDLADVFIKRDIDGRSNAEVAESLGISVAAVKSRLHRARIGLREDLNRYFSDRLKRRPRRSKNGD
jgi:RNA polymerase sigma-70 factor (ECF subfamily)